MKKCLIIVLVMLSLLLSAFTGCAEDTSRSESSITESSNDSIEEVSTESEEESLNDTSSDSSADAGEDEGYNDADAFLTNHGHKAVTEAPSIPEYCTEANTPYLYECPIDLPAAGGFSSYVSGSNVLIYSWSYSGEDDELEWTKIISWESGKVVSEDIGIDTWSDVGALDNSGFWLYDIDNTTVWFIDGDGNKDIAYVPLKNDALGSVSTVGVSPDGKYLVIKYSDHGDIRLIELESGESTIITTDITDYVWGIQYHGGCFMLLSSGSTYTVIDPVDKTAEAKEADEFGTFYGELYSYNADNAILLGVPEEDERLFLALDNDEFMLTTRAGYAISSYTFADHKLRFYDLRNSVMISAFSMGSDAYGNISELLDNGLALIIEPAAEKTKLYLYDLVSAAEDTEITTPVNVRICTKDFMTEEIASIAGEIMDKTGIEVIYGAEGNDFIDYSYLAHAATDTYRIYSAMNTVASVFELYPEGMLKEAYEDTHDGIKVYLCSDIYGVGSDGLDMAGAFVTEKDNYIVMVLDIYEDLDYNIPHEMSHVFDERIEYVSENGKVDWMEVWDDKAPSYRAYTYTYDGYEDNTEYVVTYESNPDNVWFLDEYSRTYPTEDRAVIMETLFNPADYSFIYLNDYENIKEKAILYSYILRQCFPSCDTEDTHFWEEQLGNVDWD